MIVLCCTLMSATKAHFHSILTMYKAEGIYGILDCIILQYDWSVRGLLNPVVHL